MVVLEEDFFFQIFKNYKNPQGFIGNRLKSFRRTHRKKNLNKINFPFLSFKNEMLLRLLSLNTLKFY